MPFYVSKFVRTPVFVFSRFWTRNDCGFLSFPVSLSLMLYNNIFITMLINILKKMLLSVGLDVFIFVKSFERLHLDSKKSNQMADPAGQGDIRGVEFVQGSITLG